MNKNLNKDINRRIQHLTHELLLPMQAIIADSEYLLEQLDKSELKEVAENIIEEMTKLALIVENTRASMVDLKEETYYFAKHNIYMCLIKNVITFQREANKKGIVIRKPYAIDSQYFPAIDMSLAHLTRAFANLIHNAVKYSFAGSSDKERFIDIVGEPSGNYYTISISNYGIGILPHEITSGKIFEDGYRGELAIDRFRTGTGLGLSEVRRIIEKHRGTIKITSEPKGDAYKIITKVYLPYKIKDEGE